jgi:hypothetical protein
MIPIKTSIKEVMNDDPNSPFWKRISSTPEFKKFEKELDNIMSVSVKYNKSYNDLTAEELKNERENAANN